jgi:hypothetical protein
MTVPNPWERSLSNTRSSDYSDQTDTKSVIPPRVEPETEVLLPNEARQGVTHHNVRTVLAVSTIACAVLMAVAYLVFFA